MTILDWTNLWKKLYIHPKAYAVLKYISDIGGSNSYTNLDILRCKY